MTRDGVTHSMLRRTWIAMGAGTLLRAQTASFEVATVRKNAYGSAPRQGTADGPPPPPPPPVLKPSPTGLILDNATLKYCLTWAYSVRNSQVSGPGWISEVHYDIHARMSSPVETPELRRMLQTLLTARFKLVLRRDTQERPVLGLVAARGGIKAAPAKPASESSRHVAPLPGGALRVEAKNTGLDFLEQLLSMPVWNPVVNLTGQSGGYDFAFERPAFRGMPDDILSELNAALQSQLGLRLEPRKAPLEMIEVVSGNPNSIEI